MNSNCLRACVFVVIALCIFSVKSSSPEKFILITSLYHEKNEVRRNEYKRCLSKNLVHPLIEEIVIFFDTKNPDPSNNLLQYIQNSSVRIEYIEGRPRFKCLCEYANQEYPDRKIIIANADIYFNETLSSIRTVGLEDMFIALTRWDEDKTGKLREFNNEYSQDVWIFKTPVRTLCITEAELGTWTCDAKIGKSIYEAGYKIINPSKEVKSCHVHSSNIRNYTVPKPGAASELTVTIIKDLRIPACRVDSFFKIIPSLDKDCLKACFAKYSTIKIVVMNGLHDLIPSVLDICKDNGRAGTQSMYLPDDNAPSFLIRHLEDAPVLLFGPLDGSLLADSDIITCWAGCLDNGIHVRLLYLDKKGMDEA